jgi:hypothetical protein
MVPLSNVNNELTKKNRSVKKTPLCVSSPVRPRVKLVVAMVVTQHGVVGGGGGHTHCCGRFGGVW